MNQRQAAPYEVLGVSPSASPAEVAAAYKVLVQIFHPDRFHDSPEQVRLEAEARMKALNEAYAAARSGSLLMSPSVNGSRPNGSRPRRPQEPHRTGPGGRRWAGTSWREAERDRAAQAARANRARVARQQAARNGQAVPVRLGPMSVRRSNLRGLGLARFTGNIECPGCQSVQWLPGDWRLLLDDCAFYCSYCDRLLLSR